MLLIMLLQAPLTTVRVPIYYQVINYLLYKYYLLYLKNYFKAAAKWIWTGADGFNPEYGVVVFDISINCEPIVQITVCN